MHRTGTDLEKFIKQIYQDKIRIENPVILAMNPIEVTLETDSPQ